MPGETAARLLALLTLLTAACGPAAPQEPAVAVISPPPPPPVVEVPPAKDSAPETQVAIASDDRAAPDPPAPTAQIAAPATPLRGPRAATLEALRFPPARKSPRARALVVVELQALESLFSTTPQASSDRPRVMRRLADDYVELSAAALRDGNDKLASSAQAAAIKYYAALSREAPKFCAGPSVTPASNSGGCGDEVLYFLGYEYERGALMMEARKAYFTLIQGFPASRYLPGAYLAFGELFFQEAAADPSKWPLAEQSYNEVLKYPPPDNEVYGYALLRLGAVYQAEQDPRKARVIYDRLRKGAAAHPDWDVLAVPAGLIPAGAP